MSNRLTRPIKFQEWRSSQDGVLDLLIAYSHVHAGKLLIRRLTAAQFGQLPESVKDRYYESLASLADIIDHTTQRDLIQFGELKEEIFGHEEDFDATPDSPSRPARPAPHRSAEAAG